MKNQRTMIVQDQPVLVGQVEQSDYLNLVQLAYAWTQDEEKATAAVGNWVRNRNTMDFLAVWEKMYGAGDQFQEQAYIDHIVESTKNSFSMSPLKWVETTHATGIEVKRGRGGGVYAHEDLALEFCSWLDPVFKLYVYKEFQRLKQQEAVRLSQDWSLKRQLSKINYRLHTDSIKDNIVSALPSSLNPVKRRQAEVRIYSSEADMLNKVVFGFTNAEWRLQNPQAKGGENMRDYATPNQLLVLSNIETLNAASVGDGYGNDQRLRMKYLAEKAASFFISLSDNTSAQHLAATIKALDEAKDKALPPQAEPSQE
jgi:hypothetical protein